MANAKTFLQISLTNSELELLAMLARRGGVSRATKATQLIRSAMENEEDRALSRLAEARDVPGVKWMSHKEFWKAAKVALKKGRRH